MRYIIQDIKLPANHLKDPNKVVYYLLDLNTRRLSLSYHMTAERAREVADRKNGKF